MKRYSDLEYVYYVIDDPEWWEDGKWESGNNDRYTLDLECPWLLAMVKDRDKFELIVDDEGDIFIEGREVKVSDLKCNFLANINHNVDPGRYRYEINKLRGKEVNATLFSGEYEDGGATHLDEDCPLCGHLLKINEETLRVASGTSKKCSNIMCRYKDLKEVRWKPITLKRKNNYGKGYTSYEPNSLVVDRIAQMFPSLLVGDKEICEKYGIDLSHPDNKDTGDDCYNCGGRDFKISSVGLKDIKDKSISERIVNRVCVTHHCATCGQAGRITSMGDEVTAMFGHVFGI